MARRRKRKSIVDITTAANDKIFKQQEHGRKRAAVRDAPRQERESPSPRLYEDPEWGKKDGKQYVPQLPDAQRSDGGRGIQLPAGLGIVVSN
jgi:hypothetical protein